VTVMLQILDNFTAPSTDIRAEGQRHSCEVIPIMFAVLFLITTKVLSVSGHSLPDAHTSLWV